MPAIKTRLFWSSIFLGVAVLVASGFSSVGPQALAADGDFSVVILPDTQFYSEKFPVTYAAQTEWIKQQQKTLNIHFVVHVGDLVQNATVEKEWRVADRAHAVLDGTVLDGTVLEGAVPYSVLPGNHDMEDGDTTLYNKFFSPKRFQGRDWYAGHEGVRNDNNYCIFNAAGMKFLVLSLAYSPGPDTLKWANQVLAENADCRAIVATHAYLGRDVRNSIGERVWEHLLRKHKNVFLVVCGHIADTNLTESAGDAGQKVFEMLVNYQSDPNGGDGWLRILRFSPSHNKIIVRDYSPTLDKYRHGPGADFSLHYTMRGGVSNESKAATCPAAN